MAELPQRRGRVPARPAVKQANQLGVKHLLDEAKLMDKMVWSESPRLKLDARSELTAALLPPVEKTTSIWAFWWMARARWWSK